MEKEAVKSPFDLLECTEAGIMVIAEIVNVIDPRYLFVINTNSDTTAQSYLRETSKFHLSPSFIGFCVFFSFSSSSLFLHNIFKPFLLTSGSQSQERFGFSLLQVGLCYQRTAICTDICNDLSGLEA